MKLIITALFSIMFFSANSQKSTEKIITINAFLSFQHYEHFKRLTLSSPDSPIEYLDGFEFAWGYIYKLCVRETELEEMLSDGTRYKYTLKQIISKAKVPDSAQFRLFLDAQRYYPHSGVIEQEMNITLKPINDSTYLYFDKVEIEVPESLKIQFQPILEGTVTTSGTFIFVDDQRIRLIHLSED
jgi:hypothetical protein